VVILLFHLGQLVQKNMIDLLGQQVEL